MADRRPGVAGLAGLRARRRPGRSAVTHPIGCDGVEEVGGVGSLEAFSCSSRIAWPVWSSNSRVPAPTGTGERWMRTSSANPARMHYRQTLAPPITTTSRSAAAARACSTADSIPSVTKVNPDRSLVDPRVDRFATDAQPMLRHRRPMRSRIHQETSRCPPRRLPSQPPHISLAGATLSRHWDHSGETNSSGARRP